MMAGPVRGHYARPRAILSLALQAGSLGWVCPCVIAVRLSRRATRYSIIATFGDGSSSAHGSGASRGEPRRTGHYKIKLAGSLMDFPPACMSSNTSAVRAPRTLPINNASCDAVRPWHLTHSNRAAPSTRGWPVQESAACRRFPSVV